MRIIENSKIWFSISSLIILAGLVSLICWGLNWGIDFKGGSLVEYQVKNLKFEEIKDIISSTISDATISKTKKDSILIKSSTLEKKPFEELKRKLEEKNAKVEEIRFETVGPAISKILIRKAIWALLLVSFFIILYIAWAFRSVPKGISSWKMGFSAIIALVHDVLVVIGLFSILGHFSNIEIDSYFITALLTIIGFSVYDTIVVFDRIRENLKYSNQPFPSLVNKSIMQVITRSLNTSFTTLLVLFALFLFGISTIKYFALALIIGFIAGTYSSIFIASPILVIWSSKK